MRLRTHPKKPHLAIVFAVLTRPPIERMRTFEPYAVRQTPTHKLPYAEIYRSSIGHLAYLHRMYLAVVLPSLNPNAGRSHMENIASYSLQARLIRQMQGVGGQTVCYATPVDHDCYNKECKWRRDCISEALVAKRKSLNRGQKRRSFHFK